MRTVQRRIVTGYIVSSDGKILLGKKDPTKGGVYPDCWHNPGGGVNVDETDDQALNREVLEETGIDISQKERILIDDSVVGESEKTLNTGEKITAQMHFYTFKVMLNRPSTAIVLATPSDLIELKWFPVEEIEHIKLTPPAIELITLKGSDWLTGVETT